MRSTGAIAAATAALALLVPASVQAHGSPRYYLALGDSLAVGGQPIEDDPLGKDGYADRLSEYLRARDSRVEVRKLGCGGEGTISFIHGSQYPPVSSCGSPAYYAARYPQGTQLATAAAFLRAHRGHTELITLDIGANDGACPGLPEPACVAAGLPSTQAGLDQILSGLRAADPSAPVVAMNYYNPSLGVWASDPELARTTAAAVRLFNRGLERTYAAHRVPVADVAGAFESDDFDHQLDGLPLNVALICRWTWVCSSTPDIHANADGYRVIARAFEAQL